MKSFIQKRSVFLTTFFLTSFMTASHVSAQDHSAHGGAPQEHLTHEDEEVSTMPEHSAHPQAMHMGHEEGAPMSESDGMPAQPRDPHAYSDGYTRFDGPYLLPKHQRRDLADESILAGLWVNRLETRQGYAEDFEELEGYAWLGNSYKRLMLRTNIERRDHTVEESKTELLYSSALTPFWDLEIGGRYDFGDYAHRGWFALGLSGLAPYWIELGATAYVNPDGHTAATMEAEYNMNLTQRLVLQPRLELDFYGDSDLEAGHGKGLSKSVMGFRLRYDYDRQLSPYIGYERVHRHGETTGVFEPFGQHRESQWIAGFRFWL